MLGNSIASSCSWNLAQQEPWSRHLDFGLCQLAPSSIVGQASSHGPRDLASWIRTTLCWVGVACVSYSDPGLTVTTYRVANEPPERSEAAERRASEGESEGRS